MMRALLIICVIIIFGCSNQTEQLAYGLTKKAKKTTEYLINKDTDSLTGIPIDSLTRTEIIYNRHGQIEKRKLYYLYSNESMIINLDYDFRKRLKKEIVELVNDSITFSVDYFYNGKFLDETKSDFKEEEFWSTQTGKYYYDSKDKLVKSSLHQHIIDLETKETLTNTYELNRYNHKKQVIETIFHDSLNIDENRIIKYDYGNKRLLKAKEYNQNDSLISITLYEYQLDKFGNWIERKAIRNNVLTKVIKREIEY